MAADRAADAEPWSDVVRVLNSDQAASRWTVEWAAVLHCAAAGLGRHHRGHLLDRALPQLGDDRLTRLIAGIKAAAPDRTLQQIAAQLEAMRIRTPRSRHDGTLRPLNMLARAEHPGHGEWEFASKTPVVAA